MSEQLQFAEGRTGRNACATDELDERVMEVLRAPTFCERDKEVIRVIAGHKGAAKAIRGEEIAQQLGRVWNEDARREISSVVQAAILIFKLPIGAVRHKPHGYFLIVTAEDLGLAVGPLSSEFKSLLRRIRALTSKREAARMFGQAMLKLDDEEAA